MVRNNCLVHSCDDVDGLFCSERFAVFHFSVCFQFCFQSFVLIHSLCQIVFRFFVCVFQWFVVMKRYKDGSCDLITRKGRKLSPLNSIFISKPHFVSKIGSFRFYVQSFVLFGFQTRSLVIMKRKNVSCGSNHLERKKFPTFKLQIHL